MKATNREKTRESLLSYAQKSSGLKGSSLGQNLYTRGSPTAISNFQTTWSFPSKDGTLVQHIYSLWLVAFHSYCCDFSAITSGIAGICRTHRKSLKIKTISTELTWYHGSPSGHGTAESLPPPLRSTGSSEAQREVCPWIFPQMWTTSPSTGSSSLQLPHPTINTEKKSAINAEVKHL